MPRNHPHCHHHHENRVRRGQWCALTAFSIVALVAMTSRFDSDIQSEAMETQWVASAISVVLATAALTAMAHFALREVFVGSFVEGGLSVLTTAVMAAALPYIMDPDCKLAVTSRYEGISNPILYFFSWASFITSYYIVMGYVAKCHWEWCENRNRTSGVRKFRHSYSLWCGLILTSFVVMMSANRMVIEGDCCDCKSTKRDWSDPTLPSKSVCDRVKLATGLGAVSLILSLIWSLVNMLLMKDRNDIMLAADSILVVALLVMWTFGATWLTFDEEKSPAKDLGNLFFFTWASWIIVLFMTMKSLSHAVTMTSAHEDQAVPATAQGHKRDLDALHEVDGATHVSHDERNAEILQEA